MCSLVVIDIQKKSDACCLVLCELTCQNRHVRLGGIVLAPLVTHVLDVIHRSTSGICACIIYVGEMAAE